MILEWEWNGNKVQQSWEWEWELLHGNGRERESKTHSRTPQVLIVERISTGRLLLLFPASSTFSFRVLAISVQVFDCNNSLCRVAIINDQRGLLRQ